MKNKQQSRKKSALVHVLNKETDPNLERIAKIKHWHIEQAISDIRPVATLNLTITSCGTVITKGLCIEEAQAQVLILEMQDIIARIKSQLRPAEPAIMLVRSA